jgi:hypothetical protein
VVARCGGRTPWRNLVSCGKEATDRGSKRDLMDWLGANRGGLEVKEDGEAWGVV